MNLAYLRLPHRLGTYAGISGLFWYLATPYSKYKDHPEGLEYAYREACWATTQLMISGIDVYCPISHGHGMSSHGIDPLDHLFWSRINAPFLKACHGLIVYKMKGWNDSIGVADEIRQIKFMEKPLIYLDKQELLLVESNSEVA